MKVLIISDVHGNFEALEAVAAAEPHDMVICLGDIVGYGPEPGACVRWVSSRAQLTVQGNHDRALADAVPARSRPRFEWLANAMAPLGEQQLSAGDIAWLRSLPRTAIRKLFGIKFMFVHATPEDPLYQYLGPDREGWERALATVDADLVVVGHTHLQFELVVDGKRVINPGSVGQPKDGDPRAAYAVIDQGGVRLKRVAYRIERTVSALEASGAPVAAVAVLSELLRTGRVSSDT